MTAAAHHTGEPMTLDQFLALSVDNAYRYELADGELHVNARPIQPHLRAAHRLVSQLNEQLPGELEAFAEPDVVLKPHQHKGRVRIPDVVVTRSEWRDERRLAADEVLLAVEIVSPGSWREDLLVKPFEYAEAGIPHLWVVSVTDGPVTLAPYALIAESRRYQQFEPVTGTASIEVPWPLAIELDALTARR
ncbi:Uma2 family endonuclease [Kutzneria sp. CA-103260]|uniref:Uma2 family endonuclease n=1 Tax=Kutzneria sp. CA-103260 TaxID=2802641 RepID=UPI001BF10EF0|nr:Uma2 family endonuclease [Kutzneria sp. CA-103260]QUQ64790.1 Uma2 family endonuclease [Kutzneria sp. CA-103260]